MKRFWNWPHGETCGKPVVRHGQMVPCCLQPGHTMWHEPCIPGVDFDPEMWDRHLKLIEERRIGVP
jgi:hypothetical protein